MPPWGADPAHGVFANNTSLSPTEIDAIVAWVEQGAKEGNPKDLPPAPNFSTAWEIGKPDVVLTMPESYTVAAEGADDYIYFRVPSGFTEDRWVQAAEFRPGNKKVVHHAVVFIETPEMLAMAKAAARRQGKTGDDKTPSVFESLSADDFTQKEGTIRRVKADAPVMDDGCAQRRGRSGGSSNLPLLCVYAPGRNADVWPAGTAKKVPAGSNFIFQMHYSKTTGKPESDRTSMALVFAKQPVEKIVQTLTIANTLFMIPPGANDHEVTSCYTFGRDVELVDYMPHMHVRGKDMKYDVSYPDGRTETLLWVPQYNFNWQTLYKLAKPVTIPKGARLVVTAHFDNSAKNRFNPDPTKAVRFGEPTYDEMMVAFLDYAVEKPKERAVAKLDAKILEGYAGEYSIALGGKVTIKREGDKLAIESAMFPTLFAYPESETQFFFKTIEAQATFVKNDKGEADEVIINFGGQRLRAKKIK